MQCQCICNKFKKKHDMVVESNRIYQMNLPE